MGESGERGSGISVLPARHDADDDDTKHAKSLGSPCINPPPPEQEIFLKVKKKNFYS